MASFFVAMIPLVALLSLYTMLPAVDYPNLSFQEAIAHCQELLTLVAEAKIGELELEEAVGQLVATDNGARGFFVTFLTAEDFALADQPSPAILQALRSSPTLSGELLVKNVAMSAAMAVHHQRNGDEPAAQASQRVSQRSQHLLQELQLPGVTEKLNDLERSLAGEGPYQEFLQRWGYDQEQQRAIAKALEPLLTPIN